MRRYADLEPALFGDFELDFAECELRCAGRRVAMEPNVFDLLCFLVQNPNRLLRYEELIEEVWGGVSVSRSALHYAVSRLRRALAVGNGWSLESIRGRGYRLRVQVRPARVPPPAEPTSLQI